jgi:hypothetical protein
LNREFLKKFETALMVYAGAWGKLIHEKKPEVENPYKLIKNKLKRALPLHVLLVMMGMLQLISEQTQD